MRFIAAVGVVIYHIWEVLGLEPVGMVSRAVHSLNLFVDLFFVISGFVISWVYAGRIKTSADYRTFLYKRVARLWPLHLLLLVGFIVLAVASGILSGDPKPPSLDCLWPQLLMLHGTGVCAAPTLNYPSWSISAEMVMYALFPLYLVVTRDWRLGLLTIGIVLVVLTIATALRTERPWWEWTHDFGVFRAIPGFLFGMVLYRLRDRLKSIPASRALVWITLGTFICGAAVGLPKGAVLLPIIYLLALLGIAADTRGPTGFVRRVGPAGQLTYSVYMWHAFLLAVIMSRSVRGLLGNPTGDELRNWTIVFIMAIFPVSYLSLILVERPARRWMNGLASASASRRRVRRETS